MYAMYQFCKTFACSPDEYERRPHKETQWLMQIDIAFNKATADINEKANRQQG